ncbi:MAG: diheme cytochrome c precursor [Myxococcota bacterium]
MSAAVPGGAESGRALHIFMAVVMTVVLVGFVSGTRDNPAPVARHESVRSEVGAAAAPTYASLAVTPMNRNAHWRDSVAALAPEVDRLAEIPDPVRGREKAVAERAQRRAFDGAPPVIPHPVEPRGVLACVDCHARGARIRNARAPVMSHASYTNCTQCHVPADVTAEFGPPPVDTVATENAFAPVPPPAFGARAHPRAPPTIPHPTLMRTNCTSCHGPGGTDGLKSSHPSRQSCTQCHAPGAALDHRPMMDVPPVGGGP